MLLTGVRVPTLALLGRFPTFRTWLESVVRLRLANTESRKVHYAVVLLLC